MYIPGDLFKSTVLHSLFQKVKTFGKYYFYIIRCHFKTYLKKKYIFTVFNFILFK